MTSENPRIQSELDDVFCRPHTADILLYILDKGECLKGDIYRDVCRGASAMDRLQTLERAGLLETGPSGPARPCRIVLTPKGIKVASILKELDDIIQTDRCGSSSLSPRFMVIAAILPAESL